jgi:hypothetical protein
MRWDDDGNWIDAMQMVLLGMMLDIEVVGERSTSVLVGGFGELAASMIWDSADDRSARPITAAVFEATDATSKQWPTYTSSQPASERSGAAGGKKNHLRLAASTALLLLGVLLPPPLPPLLLPRSARQGIHQG